MAPTSVPTSIIIVYPDLLCPIPSYSLAMKTSHPQSPGPSASLVEKKETQSLKVTLTSEPAYEGDIQMEYSCD